MGGLTKEWFLLLIREIFHAEYGMFVYYSHSRCYWFSTGQTDHTNLREYNLIGVLMGLAVYNSIILDLSFPGICYRKLLSPPVVPAVHANDNVGVVENPTLDDLNEIMPVSTSYLIMWSILEERFLDILTYKHVFCLQIDYWYWRNNIIGRQMVNEKQCYADVKI